MQHPKETKHAIGTAGIVQLSLQYCQTLTGDCVEDSTELATIIGKQKPLLVYPDANAECIEDINPNEITSLLFIDASWRKARRIMHESPELAALKKVKLNPKQASRYRIRKEPSKISLSTLEAIALCLSTLEKNPNKYQPLLNSMEWMIDQQIKTMGNKVFEENYNVVKQ